MRPLSAAAVSIPGLATSWAPPEVAPARSRTASPPDLAKALIAGPEPMNVMSSELPSSAPTASVPSLKVWVVSLVAVPSSAANSPCRTPISAVAWVMLGK